MARGQRVPAAAATRKCTRGDDRRAVLRCPETRGDGAERNGDAQRTRQYCSQSARVVGERSVRGWRPVPPRKHQRRAYTARAGSGVPALMMCLARGIRGQPTWQDGAMRALMPTILLITASVSNLDVQHCAPGYVATSERTGSP